MKRLRQLGLQVIGLSASAALLSGCTGLQQAIGIAKSPPDEFAVVKKAPLVIPPDYTLRPPEPGAPRPQELRPSDSARIALLGEDGETEVAQSKGETLLLQSARADRKDPNIRTVLNEENGKLKVKDQAFADQVIFYDPVGTTSAVPVADVSTQALGAPAGEPGKGDSAEAAQPAEIGQEKEGGLWSRVTGIF